MFEIILTLDYEIHGNGEGAPLELMVEPTDRMLRQFDAHGAKLTVMPDIGEVLRFRQYAEETGRDDFSYHPIACQLKHAVRTGHDVQLHIHPSYFNAQPAGDRWALDYAEYDLARLRFERIDAIVHSGKTYLEQLLRPVDESYACVASRSANWSMHPSPNVVRALVDNGIRIDTSVFKYGRRAGAVQFDYRDAHSELVPWPVDSADVCRADPAGELLEFPIYSENRRIQGFISVNRFYRAIQSRRHPLPSDGFEGTSGGSSSSFSAGRVRRALALLAGRHAWKLDFNQCSGRQLIAGLKRAARRYDAPEVTLPVVLIGHSKLFTRRNERQLKPFLEYVAEHPDRYRFATLRESLEHVSLPAA